MEKYMMNVQGCCGCFSLRTGTLILLWWGLISSFLSLGVLSLGVVAYGVVNFHNDEPYAHGIEFYITVIFLYLIVNLVFLRMIPCALGLYGIQKNKPSYLKPYIFTSIFGIFSSQSFEEFGEKTVEDPNMSTETLVFLTILQFLIGALISWYFASVVYRYYLQLKNEQPATPYAREL